MRTSGESFATISNMATGAGLEPAPPGFPGALTVKLPCVSPLPAWEMAILDMSGGTGQDGGSSMSGGTGHKKRPFGPLLMSGGTGQGVRWGRTGFCFFRRLPGA